MLLVLFAISSSLPSQGAVGNDDFGRQLAKEAAKDGVNVRAPLSAANANPVCLASVTI